MGEGFWIFIFIVFILAPILERVLKGGANTRRPPGRVPGQRPMPRRPLPGQQFPPSPGGPSAGTSVEGGAADATDLIPADLWEILTGQRRVEPAPPPAPTPPPPAPVATQPPMPSYRRPAPSPAPVATQPPPPSHRRPAPSPAPAQPRDRMSRPPDQDEEAVAAELLRRRDEDWQLQNAPPIVVSLETEPLPEAGRHAAYHDKREHLSRPAKVQRGRGPIDLHLTGRSELRRAILLQEVLGRPRGLDD